MDPLTLLAGSSLIGGALSFFGSKKANDINASNSRLQYDLARNSVQYRVQDAEKAGIHPLYALGAPTMSSSFSTSQNELAGLGQSVTNAGQQVALQMLDKASKIEDVSLKRSQKHYWMEKAREVDLKNAVNDPFDPRFHEFRRALQNKGQSNARVGAPVVKKGTKYHLPGGQVVKPKAGETKGQVYEDMYGEAGDGVLSPYYWNNLYRAWRDYYNK